MKKIFVFISLAFIAAGCSKLSPDYGNWTLTVDGKTTKYTVAAGQCVWTEAGKSNNDIALHASKETNNITVALYLDYNYTGTGTYKLPDNYSFGYRNLAELYNYPAAKDAYLSSTFSDNSGGTKRDAGTITISKVTATELEGSFDYNGQNSTGDVKHISGTFSLKK